MTLVYSYIVRSFRVVLNSSGDLSFQYCFTVEFSDEMSMRSFIHSQPYYLRFEVTVREFTLVEGDMRFVNAFSWCEQSGQPLSSVDVERVSSSTEETAKGVTLLSRGDKNE